jgi:hypothetical protein
MVTAFEFMRFLGLNMRPDTEEGFAMKFTQAGLCAAASALTILICGTTMGANESYTPASTSAAVAPVQRSLNESTTPRAAALVFEGAAHVIDAAHIEIDNQEIGFLTYEACSAEASANSNNSASACSSASKVVLARLVDGWTVRCTGHMFDAGKLLLASCKREDGLDVASALSSQNDQGTDSGNFAAQQRPQELAGTSISAPGNRMEAAN